MARRRQRGLGNIFRGRKRQRGKKQKGGILFVPPGQNRFNRWIRKQKGGAMEKEAKKLVKSLRNYSAVGLQKLAKTVKP